MVLFEGTLETAYRACLWSRVASRILLPLKTFSAPNPAKLYGGVKSIRWSEHLGPDNTLAVDYTVSGQAQAPQETISHTHFGALKAKDAIVDQFRSTHGTRPSVDPLQPDVRIHIHVNAGEATVSLDLSGESLQRRGYRLEGGKAPLKENLAAAILLYSAWPRKLREARQAEDSAPSFIDPMCGSGTLPIEAGLIATNTAPGLNRTYFGFLGWRGHDPKLWERLKAEAREKIIQDPKALPKIVGYDENPQAVKVALANIERAGLRGKVHVEKRELSQCQAVSASGWIILNPPYGERLGEVEELKPLYKRIGDLFKQQFKGWEGWIFTGSPELAKSIGLKTSRRIPLFNGPIECRLLGFKLY